MTDFKQDDGTYRGPERRSGKERRQARDRRDEIRFEIGPDKGDRRSGKDRRKTGLWDRTPRRD